jgi:AraC family transcriptional regulator
MTKRASPTPVPHDAVLKREWRGTAGIRLRLSHYPRAGTQSRHAHDHHQVSFLLAGGLAETIGRRRHEPEAPAACVKPAGAEHCNQWGRSGALLLSARIDQWDTGLTSGSSHGAWSRIDGRRVSPILGLALAAPDCAQVDSLVDDLLALLDPGPARRSSTPPPWLRRVREAIAESGAVSADTAARIAGVHRVHLSRAFAQHFGEPLGAYRHRVMIGRAIEAALRSADTLAQVAHQAGFADQSHMHRAIRRSFGATPRHLRQAFARLTA